MRADIKIASDMFEVGLSLEVNGSGRKSLGGRGTLKFIT